MPQFLPFLAWLAAITSAVLLIVLIVLGEFRPRILAFLLCWFLVAAYCQFLSGSFIVSAVGLSLQTILAVALMIRFKLSV